MEGYILAYCRTPIGAYGGLFSNTGAIQIGIEPVRHCVDRSKEHIDNLYMGCVLSCGVGQAPARQVAIANNLVSTNCVTINKVCGSGMYAVCAGYDAIRLGEAACAISGGMECMSMAPHFLKKMRFGCKFGDVECIDHMLFDGLRDAVSGLSMGEIAEKCAKQYNINKSSQDQYAYNTAEKAKKASENGIFDKEILNSFEEKDEIVGRIKLDRIHQLKPVFLKDGTITAASSSSIADGAAAILIGNQDVAKSYKTKYKILGYRSASIDPEMFPVAPVFATKSLMNDLNIHIKDVDIFEINEAFAIVPLIMQRELGLDMDKINIYGGSCAMGHPIGASGARIIVTLINALNNTNGKIGIAAICIGGGEGLAIAIEKIKE